MRNLVPLACLALVAAAGCAARPNTTEDLAGEVRAYSEGVRWRRYEDAAAKLPPALREAFLDAHDELDEDLFVDDYEIARLKLHRDRNSAIVQVKYTWHLDSVGVVHDTVVEQRWRRHGKAWLREEEYRRRGEPMPGLEDAPEEPPERPDPHGPGDAEAARSEMPPAGENH